MPDYQRQRAFRLRYPQHLTKSGKRVRKEHDTQAADYHVKEVITERQRARGALPETNVCYSATLCLALCGLNHFKMKGYLTVETEEEFAKWYAKEAEDQKEE